MSRLSIVLILSLISFVSAGQRFSTKQYRVEEGLPTDIMKGCVEDSLGFFWIATDEGLVKYDGIKFTTYRGITHSNYVKGFFTTSSGRLLVYGDLDFMEIKNTGDTVFFDQVSAVSRIENDSTLSYPKLVFESKDSALWISESQAVVRIHKGIFKRYNFDTSDRTPQFLRSFAFFEDKIGDLYVSSFQGRVFKYNVGLDKFETLQMKFPAGVEFISAFGSKLVIGSAEGVSEATLSGKGGFERPKLSHKIPFVSFITPINDQEYFVATRGDNHFILNLEKGTLKPFSEAIRNINHVYVSNENDIWLSGNDGLTLVRENLFQGVNDRVTDFIESIAEDPVTGDIYYATSLKLYAYNKKTEQNRVVLDIPSGYFQSLIATKDGIWIANAFRVFLFQDGKIKKEFDFSEERRFVTSITKDSEGNIWLAIPGLKQAYMIDRTLGLHKIDVPLGNDGAINLVCEGPGGVYVGSGGKKAYLFHKATGDSVFRNISDSTSVDVNEDFNVINIATAVDQLWLATSAGLHKFINGRLVKINLGKYTGLPVKAIAQLKDQLLIAIPFGMLLYDTKSGYYDLYNESTGLLSRTVTAKGLFVDKTNRVWAGTSRGLCFSVSPFEGMKKTARPKFVNVLVNGETLSSFNSNTIDYGSFISLQVSSITFPENQIQYHYRLTANDTWKATERSDISFANLSAGDYALEVIARKNGGYSWSDPSFLNFSVAAPVWQSGWFYLLALIGASCMVFGTYAIVSVRSYARNEKLKSLIAQRTEELRQRNDELIELNNEKNNLIGIVAHDLKSPLNQITGLIGLIGKNGNLDAESVQYLTHMDSSARRLNEMIAKILDVDAIESKQLNLKMEKTDVSKLLDAVVDRYILEGEKKDITISRQIVPGSVAIVDKAYLEQVFENLLSNAIKFSPRERVIFVTLNNVNDKAICSIKDEGPGLTAEDKKKLFGKYQRLSARPTGNETSTGLGLSIVKKFVTAMNGEVWCESEEGNGACFYISFARVFR